jgi:hypothetical protein
VAPPSLEDAYLSLTAEAPDARLEDAEPAHTRKVHAHG